MKKLTALLLALLLALACIPALAASDTQVYTHPTHGFSITVPATWLVLDAINYQAYIDAYKSGAMTFTGTNADTIAQVAPQLLATNAAMAIDPYGNNIMLTATDLGIAIGDDLFIALLVPQLKQQMLAQLPTLNFVMEGEKLALGDHTFICMSATYEMYGLELSIDQLYLLDNTFMYLFNLTASPQYSEEIIGNFYTVCYEILSTFQVPGAVSLF